MAGRLWTAEEVAAVRACSTECELRALAPSIGRTFHALKRKRARLRNPPPAPGPKPKPRSFNAFAPSVSGLPLKRQPRAERAPERAASAEDRRRGATRRRLEDLAEARRLGVPLEALRD